MPFDLRSYPKTVLRDRHKFNVRRDCCKATAGWGGLEWHESSAVARGEPSDKGRMFGRRQSEIERGAHTVDITGEQRLGVKPEAREDLRAINAVGAGSQLREVPRAPDEP